MSHLYFITILDNLSRYPLFLMIGKSLLPWATTAVRDRHSGYTRKQVERWVLVGMAIAVLNAC